MKKKEPVFASFLYSSREVAQRKSYQLKKTK